MEYTINTTELYKLQLSEVISSFKEDSLKLPGELDVKLYEFFFIAKFVYFNWDKIKISLKNKEELSIAINKCEEFFNKVGNKDIKEEIDVQSYQEEFYLILHSFNINSRLKMNLKELKEYEEKIIKENTGRNLIQLPNSLPTEYLDIRTWQTGNDELDHNTYIGHGYYWRTGDCESKDINGCGDYDNLESKFHKVDGSSVVVCDYELLKKDFSEYLEGKTDQEINEWLVDQVAYISEGQLNRISPGGDLHEYLDTENLFERINKDKLKCAIRYRGGGRAVNFVVEDKVDFVDSHCIGKFINVKGVGTEKIAEGLTVKENGFLSLVDALKEYSYEKLIHRVLEKEEAKCTTVQTYAIVDLGIKYKSDVKNPSTSYEGDKCVLTVRQCSSRFVSSPYEIAYYSVVPMDFQTYEPVAEFIRVLSKYGITSEQIPLSVFGEKGLEGQWNIQADATLTRLVDFSQYYIIPGGELILYSKWQMSKGAFFDGIKCCKDAIKKVFSNQLLLKEIFDTEKSEEAQESYQKELSSLQIKYSEIAGKMNKSKTSWSWFLETDDSEVFNFAMTTGLKHDLNEVISPKELHSQIISFINL